jgi:hypothetical protein
VLVTSAMLEALKKPPDDNWVQHLPLPLARELHLEAGDS